MLQEYHDTLVFAEKPLPIPSSFLMDTQGRITAIYKGPVGIKSLIADTTKAPETYVDRWERSACLPGQAISHDRITRAARLAETRSRYRVASYLFGKGLLEDAAVGFQLSNLVAFGCNTTA